MMLPPKIDNAPGHVWKPRKIGWELRWACRTDLVTRGFPIKSLRVWTGPESELTDSAIAIIQDKCKALQNEMLVWAHGGMATVSTFNGSWSALIACFKSDPASGFEKLRYVTRVQYRSLLRRLERDMGDTLVCETKARHIVLLYEGWIKPSEDGGEPKLAMGHAMVGMVRMLANFGASILEDEECERVANMLHRKKFKTGAGRTATLNLPQIVAICAKAREDGLASIALAQAIQFEFTWRQKDVIGEWVPVSEPVLSTVTSGNQKWLRGVRWEEMSADGVISHVTSKRLKKIVIDVKNAPLVIKELMASYPGSFVEREVVHPLTGAVTIVRDFYRDKLPASGPVIVSEITRLPYDQNFRRLWRKIATNCGVPGNVRNMDTRAGAITEAFRSGVRPDAIQKSATHSNMSMTNHYNRNDADDIAESMQTRAAGRNKT